MTMSAKEVRKLQEDREKEYGGKSKDTWVPAMKNGETRLMRIGPPWVEDGEFWKDRLIHGSYKHKVYCAKNDIDDETGDPRKCKVCRRLRHLKTDRSDYGSALFKLIMQRREGLWNVVFADFKEKDGKYDIRGILDPKKFQVLQYSQQWSNLLMEFFAEEDYREESKLGITDLKRGRWIRVTRKGEGMDTEYKFRVLEARQLKSKSNEVPDRHDLVKTLVNLDKLVKGSSDEELESFLEDMEKKAKKKAASSSGSGSKSSGSGSKSSSGSKSASKSESKSKSASKSGSDDAKAAKVLKEMKKNLKDKKKGKKDKSSSSGSKSASKSESKSASKSESKSGSKSSSGSKSASKSGSGSSD